MRQGRNYTLPKTQKLQNKIAVITGASSGIGREIALLFSQEGASLVLAARRKEKLIALSKEIRRTGGNVLPVKTDVTDEKQVERMVKLSIKTFGEISTLINCAGVGIYGPIEDCSLKDFQKMLDVNLKGVFLCCRAVVRQMAEQRDGHIINIVSLAGTKGMAYHSAYCAAKFGVAGLGQAIASEYEAYNVRVTSICPGGVDTSFWDDKPKYSPPKDMMLKAKDVAELALYVASLPPTALVDEVIIRPNYCYKMALEGKS